MKRFLLIPLLLCGCIASQQKPGPSPAPSNQIAAATAASARDYIDRSAAAFESLANRVGNGEFKTQSEFATEIERLTKAARVDGFAEMREAWQADNPADWDTAKDAEKCRQSAAGFREVLK